GDLIQQLQADRALTGDYSRIIEAVDIGQAAGGGELVGVAFCVSKIVTMEDDICSEAAAGGDLDQRREAGHHDGDWNFQITSVTAEGRRVVAGGGGDAAGGALGGRQKE